MATKSRRVSVCLAYMIILAPSPFPGIVCEKKRKTNMQCRLIQSKALSAVHTMLPEVDVFYPTLSDVVLYLSRALFSTHRQNTANFGFCPTQNISTKMAVFSLLARSLVFQSSAFPNELSSLGTLETHCSHFLTAVTTLPYKNTAFTSSDCWRAGGSLLLCVQIHLHICSPHRTRRLDRAPPTVCTNPRVTKNMGRSAAGTFTRRVMGNHILT